MKRNYAVRNLLRGMLRFGLILLLMISCIATLIAFYIMIEYQVVQSITLGHMKNLSIHSQNIADLKENDLEMIGNDLTVSARQISDLLSRPTKVASQEYIKKRDAYVTEAV